MKETEASSGDKRAGTHLGDVGSRLSQSTRPVREHVQRAQLLLDADAYLTFETIETIT